MKTIFTCSYDTYAFKIMLFGIYNAPTRFERCILTLFMTLWRTLQVFTDDFSIFVKYLEAFLQNLDKVLAHCEETNLVLN